MHARRRLSRARTIARRRRPTDVSRLPPRARLPPSSAPSFRARDALSRASRLRTRRRGRAGTPRDSTTGHDSPRERPRDRSRARSIESNHRSIDGCAPSTIGRAHRSIDHDSSRASIRPDDEDSSRLDRSMIRFDRSMSRLDRSMTRFRSMSRLDRHTSTRVGRFPRPWRRRRRRRRRRRVARAAAVGGRSREDASTASMSRDLEAREWDGASGRRRGDARSMGRRREARGKRGGRGRRRVGVGREA